MDKNSDKNTDKNTIKNTDKYKDKHTNKHTDRRSDKHTDRRSDKHTDKNKNTDHLTVNTDAQFNILTSRKTNRYTHTERQSEKGGRA